MDKDKAIRSAKLTAAGILDKARARTAVTRAGGQIAPSKYLPDVPRQVHADGGRENGKVAFMQGNHPDVPPVMYHGTGAAKDFSSFSLPGNKTNRKTGGNAIYLSTSPETAGTFANYGESPRIIPAHVSAKNPFDFRNPDHIDALQGTLTKNFKNWFPGAMYGPQTAINWMRGGGFGILENDNVRSWMKRRGHDSYFVTEGEGKPLNLAVFKPTQIKSAIGNQGTFDPNDPDITKAEGGSVTDSDEFRNWFGNSATHTDGDPHVLYTGTSKDKDFTSFNVGRHGAWFTRDPAEASQYAEQNDSQGYKQDGWKLTPTNTASRVIPAYVKAENPYTGDLPDEVLRSNYKAAQSDWFDTLRRKGHDAWIPARHNGDLVVALKEPQQIKSIFNNGKFDPNQKHMNKAGGGRIHAEDGGKMELRSRAAEAIRNQPQLKGNVNQLLAVAAKGKGVKQAELLNAGRPSGNIVSKEELAKHFEDAVPQVGVERLGGRDSNKPYKYSNWTLPGGEKYREHLLHLPPQEGQIAKRKKALQDQWQQAYENRAPKEELDRIGAEFDNLPSGEENPDFQSNHWSIPNVLAHVRMDDRDNGKTLHVQEVQSDWGQKGREKGFYDPVKPIEVFHTGTGETVHATDDMGEAKDKAEQLGPEYDYGHQGDDKVPQGPYVGNTQQWTDLAVKHALTEAAKGGHDRVVFSPGEANADLYGQRKKVQKLEFLKSKDSGEEGILNAYSKDGRRSSQHDVKNHAELAKLLGKENSANLLSQPPTPTPQYSDDIYYHTLEGPLQVGGHGMVDYYNNIVHPAALKLLQQHDPSIKPESYDLPSGYKGFGLPMTDTARQSILKNGFGAFKRGGTVGKAGGGEMEGVEGNNQNGVMGNENETAPLNLAPRAQAGGLPDAGGIRGGIGVLQAQNEASLEGLPTKVSIPLTGGSVSAGHDPRIRQIARDYMASTGLPYNPPTKYAKVDPKRASRIAAAYDEMADNASDPLTKASYDAMIKETMAQYHAAKNAGFKAEFWNPDTEEDPYKASPRLATEDVRNNHHMWVYPTRSGYGSDGPITAKELEENPLLQDSGETWNGQPATVNDIFRAVHDYYGHAKEGVGFRGDGEENAWRSHASMYSPLARMAMTSETRGQNSWLNYGVHGEKNRNARTEDTVFAPQKVGILPHWAHHEGAEDFMGPEEVNAMAAIRKVHKRANGGAVDAALALTRRFTKDGKAATVALKPKGK